MLISSHQISDLERFADHVGVLHRGRLLTEGATADLIERYQQIEFEAENAQAFQGLAGLSVQARDGSRWRAVAETAVCPPAGLTARGAREVRSQRLTLEELFLALTQ